MTLADSPEVSVQALEFREVVAHDRAPLVGEKEYTAVGVDSESARVFVLGADKVLRYAEAGAAYAGLAVWECMDVPQMTSMSIVGGVVVGHSHAAAHVVHAASGFVLAVESRDGDRVLGSGVIGSMAGKNAGLIVLFEKTGIVFRRLFGEDRDARVIDFGSRSFTSLAVDAASSTAVLVSSDGIMRLCERDGLSKMRFFSFPEKCTATGPAHVFAEGKAAVLCLPDGNLLAVSGILSDQGDASWTRLADPTFGDYSVRTPKWIFTSLAPWKERELESTDGESLIVHGLLVAAESGATDVGVYAAIQRSGADAPLGFVQLFLESEQGLPILPISQRNPENDAHPVDACIDYTSPNGLPVLLFLTTDGSLCPFHVCFAGEQKHPLSVPSKAAPSTNILADAPFGLDAAADAETPLPSDDGELFDFEDDGRSANFPPAPFPPEITVPIRHSPNPMAVAPVLTPAKAVAPSVKSDAALRGHADGHASVSPAVTARSAVVVSAADAVPPPPREIVTVPPIVKPAAIPQIMRITEDLGLLQNALVSEVARVHDAFETALQRAAAANVSAHNQVVSAAEALRDVDAIDKRIEAVWPAIDTEFSNVDAASAQVAGPLSLFIAKPPAATRARMPAALDSLERQLANLKTSDEPVDTLEAMLDAWRDATRLVPCDDHDDEDDDNLSAGDFVVPDDSQLAALRARPSAEVYIDVTLGIPQSHTRVFTKPARAESVPLPSSAEMRVLAPAVLRPRVEGTSNFDPHAHSPKTVPSAPAQLQPAGVMPRTNLFSPASAPAQPAGFSAATTASTSVRLGADALPKPDALQASPKAAAPVSLADSLRALASPPGKALSDTVLATKPADAGASSRAEVAAMFAAVKTGGSPAFAPPTAALPAAKADGPFAFAAPKLSTPEKSTPDEKCSSPFGPATLAAAASPKDSAKPSATALSFGADVTKSADAAKDAHLATPEPKTSVLSKEPPKSPIVERAAAEKPLQTEAAEPMPFGKAAAEVTPVIKPQDAKATSPLSLGELDIGGTQSAGPPSDVQDKTAKTIFGIPATFSASPRSEAKGGVSFGMSFGGGSPFGGSTASTALPPPTDAHETSFAFGKTAFGTPSAAVPFGQSADIKTSPFGTSTDSKASPFGTTTDSKSSPFGTTADIKAPPFGQNVDTKATPFGQTTDTKTFPFETNVDSKASPFGQTVDSKASPFGQTVENRASPFGQTSGLQSGPSAFGQAANALPASPAFGQTSSFGGAFGFKSLGAGSASFGQTSTFGTSTVFGQPSSVGTSTVFGQPSSVGTNTVFGQPSSVGPSAAFGGTASAQPLGFGSTAFGQPSAGQNTGGPSLFGQIAAEAPPPAKAPEVPLKKDLPNSFTQYRG